MDLSRESGSITVVAGATGALGGALVRDLLDRGHRVAAWARRADAALGEMAGRASGRLVLVAVESSTGAEYARAVSATESALGPPSGAVLAAGAWRGGAALHASADTADDDWAAMMAANAGSVHLALRALLPGMVRRGSGSIVVVASRAAVRPWESAGAAAYAAAKSAAVGLVGAAAAEAGPHGVRVNAVLPGTIDTAANRSAMPAADHARWVSTASLAAVIAFLLSDDARDVCGAAIPVFGRG